jgi:hypothetical protein
MTTRSWLGIAAMCVTAGPALAAEHDAARMVVKPDAASFI